MPRGRWRRWRGFDGFSQKHGDAILMQMTGFEVGGWTFPLVTQQLNRTGPRGNVYVGVSVNYKTYFNHMRRRRQRFTGNQWINCKKHEELIWRFLFFYILLVPLSVKRSLVIDRPSEPIRCSEATISQPMATLEFWHRKKWTLELLDKKFKSCIETCWKI